MDQQPAPELTPLRHGRHARFQEKGRGLRPADAGQPLQGRYEFHPVSNGSIHVEVVLRVIMEGGSVGYEKLTLRALGVVLVESAKRRRSSGVASRSERLGYKSILASDRCKAATTRSRCDSWDQTVFFFRIWPSSHAGSCIKRRCAMSSTTAQLRIRLSCLRHVMKENREGRRTRTFDVSSASCCFRWPAMLKLAMAPHRW